MSHSTFTYLCNELRQAIQRRDTVMRKAIPVELRIALTLWRLATTTDYRNIGHLFGVSKAAACTIANDVCAAIVEILVPLYIKVPTGDVLQEVIYRMAPNVRGAQFSRNTHILDFRGNNFRGS